MPDEKYRMNWADVFHWLEQYDKPEFKIYGVPRGGMIIAGFLNHAQNVYNPNQADFIIDDIIDSGTTRDRYRREYPEKPFVALIDKQTNEDHANLGWVVFPWETDEQDSIEDAVTRQLQYIGEDLSREGLAETPARVVKSWAHLFSGYNTKIEDLMTIFTDGACDEMVILKDIEFYSTCEHHLLPFMGVAHIAYIPNGKVIGISKLARLLEMFSRRLQIQERIGEQITSALMQHLEPKGAACVIESEHLCMKIRGVEKKNSKMITSSLKGVFMEKPEVRAEFMGFIK